MKKPSFSLSYLDRPGPSGLFIAILGLSLLNLGFSWLNNIVLTSPLFLDSVFTAVGAVLFGPWAGMAIGLLTNLGMEPLYGMTGFYAPFAACNMATGLILGLMARKGVFNLAWHVTLAVVLVTAANAILGGFIANLVFSGSTGVQIDNIVSAFTELGLSLVSSNFWARIPTNLIDKMLAVYSAFAVRFVLERRETRREPAA